MYYNPYNFVQPQQAQASPMIWVRGGESSANAYIVAPGNTVPLWDSENQVIYIKSVDANGIPTMRILDYTERTLPHSKPNIVDNDYITRKEFQAFVDSVKPIRKEDKDESFIQSDR